MCDQLCTLLELRMHFGGAEALTDGRGFHLGRTEMKQSFLRCNVRSQQHQMVLNNPRV